MTDTKRIFQVTTILGTLFLIGLIFYFLSQGYFTDSTKLQALLNQTGIFAPLLFILLQIFQVIIPIIPGGAHGKKIAAAKNLSNFLPLSNHPIYLS